MNSTLKGYIFLVIGVLGFSMKSIFIKLAYLYHVDTVPLIALRMLFSAPFYIVVLLYLTRHKDKRSSKQVTFYTLLVLCAVGYYAASITDMYALKFISVGLERIVLFTFPLFALLLSIFILNKKYSLKVIIPFLICFLGIAITFFFSVETQTEVRALVIGLSLALASAITYALYFVMSEKALVNNSSIKFNAQLMLLACILTIIQYVFQFPLSALFSQETPVYLIAFLMAVFSTVLPSFFIMSSIKTLSASTTALFNNLGPFITIYLGYIILKEAVSIGEMIGFIVVVLGVISLRKFK